MISLKLIIFFAIASLNFNSLLSEELSSWGQLSKKGNTYYKKSDDTPFTGVLKNLFPSGEISVIDHFKNGKQHGEFKSFHKNGKLSMIGKFHEGEQVGEWSEFYDDGSLYWKLNYIDGKKADGLFQMFHQNGSLKSEVFYKDDKPSTNWVYYNENGEKVRIDIYKDGKFFYEKHINKN
tara:strand:- start:23 stop:556 length:534 start_codon:yes stop_codon:yes gene_type:complete